MGCASSSAVISQTPVLRKESKSGRKTNETLAQETHCKFAQFWDHVWRSLLSIGDLQFRHCCRQVSCYHCCPYIVWTRANRATIPVPKTVIIDALHSRLRRILFSAVTVDEVYALEELFNSLSNSLHTVRHIKAPSLN